jgi:hypothetical protein
MATVVLLGPQRFTPTLGEAVAATGFAGRLASVTAGWQEREGEDLELHEHLGERTVNLMLYARAEDAFERDPELFAAHRERQGRLRELQEIYRRLVPPRPHGSCRARAADSSSRSGARARGWRGPTPPPGASSDRRRVRVLACSSARAVAIAAPSNGS